MRFEFATATRILFGPGSMSEVAPAAAALGRRALLVTGRDVERSEPLRERLTAQGIAAATFAVAGDPTLETARAGLQRARGSVRHDHRSRRRQRAR
jgi:alcohol dehydrogenase class IV